MKIRPVGNRQTDGQTDATKLIVAFRNFSKAPKRTLRRWSDSSLPVYQHVDQQNQ